MVPLVYLFSIGKPPSLSAEYYSIDCHHDVAAIDPGDDGRYMAHTPPYEHLLELGS